MPRIPDTEIERLKNEVAVERLVESSGIDLKKSGKDLLGRCPFHADDTASLVVTPSKNLWHCFGCQVGGGPIDWVMKKNGVSFRHAIEMLHEGLSSLAARGGGVEGRAVKHTTVRGLPAPVAFDADDQQLMNDTVAFYHERLKQTPQALGYLEARGIASIDAIDTFKLGFADRTLGLRLPDKRRREGQAIRQRLERMGLFRPSGHEHFTGSLIIPVMDANGNVTEIYGRKITAWLRPGTPSHLYLPAEGRSAGRGVWNLQALQGSHSRFKSTSVLLLLLIASPVIEFVIHLLVIGLRDGFRRQAAVSGEILQIFSIGVATLVVLMLYQWCTKPILA